jgi:hypothetical protein
MPGLRGQVRQHRSQFVLPQTAQPQLCSHPQRKHRGDDHGGARGRRPGSHHLQHVRGRGSAMIDVVDHQQSPVPAAQHAHNAVKRQRPGVTEHPRGEITGRASIGQQTSPRQTAMLAADRGGAQHLEPAAGALPRGGSRQFGAARAGRAGDGQHAAPAGGGAVKQPSDLGHLATSAR